MLSRLFSFFRTHRSMSCENLVDPSLDVLETPEHKEYEYLRLLTNIMENGSIEATRDGKLTKVLYGQMMKFDLSDDTLPLITTKQVSFRNVLCELFWFIHGDTDVGILASHGVTIWNKYTSPEYLKLADLDHRYQPYNDAGPIYSHQWRHYGTPYYDCYTDYYGKGIDQLQNVLNILRNCPQSQQNILLSWNPEQIDECVLPPYHVMAQFRVLRGHELHCHLIVRSSDCVLDLPYNICSYAILTHLLAKLSNLNATELTVSIGDAHIYQAHWDVVPIQLTRIPFEFPKISIVLPKSDAPLDIDDVSMASIHLRNYRHHPKIAYAIYA